MAPHVVGSPRQIAAVLRSIPPASFQHPRLTRTPNAESIQTEGGADGCANHADEGTPLAMVDNIAFAIDLIGTLMMIPLAAQ